MLIEPSACSDIMLVLSLLNALYSVASAPHPWSQYYLSNVSSGRSSTLGIGAMSPPWFDTRCHFI